MTKQDKHWLPDVPQIPASQATVNCTSYQQVLKVQKPHLITKLQQCICWVQKVDKSKKYRLINHKWSDVQVRKLKSIEKHKLDFHFWLLCPLHKRVKQNLWSALADHVLEQSSSGDVVVNEWEQQSN